MSVSALRWQEHGWRRKGTSWVAVHPTQTTLRKLATALDVPVDELAKLGGNLLSAGRRKATALRLAAVLPSSGGDPFWALVLEGLRQALPPSWIIMAFPTGEDREVERAVLDQIADLGYDGLVLAPTLPLTWPEPDARGHHPIVVIDRRPDGVRPSHVEAALVIDNGTAVSVATRRLLEQGKVQRLACVAGPLELSGLRQRFDAVKNVLRLLKPDLLARPDEQWVPTMRRADAASGEEAMSRLFLQPDDQVPDGVICLNGKMTVGALLAIRAHRKHIPDDIRFVGYDDGLWNYGLACADPPPSLIRQDPEQLGRAAARLITSRRAGQQPNAQVYVEAARFDAAPGGTSTCDAMAS